jgi:hypothetical protein
MLGSIALLLTLIGAALVALAASQRSRSLLAWTWPTVRGIIRAAEVVRHAHGVGGNGPPSYMARVQYDYDVEGRSYHGTCLSDGMPEDHTRGHPDALVLRYAPGNVTLVHHHPGDPARAVLEIHPRGAGVAAALAGSLFLAAGGVAAALATIVILAAL